MAQLLTIFIIFLSVVCVRSSNNTTITNGTHPTKINSRGVVNVTCTTSQQCGSHGQCSSTLFICECNKGYTTNNYTQPCEYEQKSKVTAICLSIFFGSFGADWFYLNAGYSGYIVGGVFKLLTLGGLGIWWIVDIFRIGFNVFLDGQGIPLV